MSWTWTPQQEAIFSACETGGDHVACNSVAGSAKTTTSVESALRTPGRVGMVAFNVHIKTALNEKLKGRVTAQTLNGLGYQACLKTWKCKLEERKAERIMGELYPEWQWKGRDGNLRPTDEARAAIHLANLCKYTLTTPLWDENLRALIDHYGVEMPERGVREVLDAVPQLLHEAQRQTETVDFTDQVQLPIVHGINVGEFDTLYVDEAQDLSRAQQELARRAAKRLVVVGDKNQAIMGFAGADCESFPNLCKALGETGTCLDLPLTVTFRCPTSHVELARKIVPQIEAAPNAVEGIVDCISPSEVSDEVMPGDMVICRTNAPIVALGYYLIRRGIPTLVRGRDIGKGLRSLVDQLKPVDTADLCKKLMVWHEKELQRLRRRNATEQQIESANDRVECLDTLASHSASLEELYRSFDQLFSRDDDDPDEGKGKVVLSSVHRAKGLEANRVVVLTPERLPLIRKDQRPWQLVQEMNLCYIAVTRAKKELLFAGNLPPSVGGPKSQFQRREFGEPAQRDFTDLVL